MGWPFTFLCWGLQEIVFCCASSLPIVLSFNSIKLRKVLQQRQIACKVLASRGLIGQIGNLFSLAALLSKSIATPYNSYPSAASNAHQTQPLVFISKTIKGTLLQNDSLKSSLVSISLCRRRASVDGLGSQSRHHRCQWRRQPFFLSWAHAVMELLICSRSPNSSPIHITAPSQHVRLESSGNSCHAVLYTSKTFDRALLSKLSCYSGTTYRDFNI